MLSMLFVELSLVTIVILSLQSYITLAHPYQYRTITKSRLVKAIAFSFFLVLFSSLSVVWSRYFLSRVLPAIIILAITIVVLTWCWTYNLISRHQKAIKTSQTPSPRQKVSRRKILRSTITAFVVIACLLACYFLALFLFLSVAFFNRVVFSDTITRNVWLVAVTSFYLNSLLNPCLVFWRSTSFRETLENILTCQKKTKSRWFNIHAALREFQTYVLWINTRHGPTCKQIISNLQCTSAHFERNLHEYGKAF